MPCLLIVLCLINYFDLYDRTMKCLGMKQFMFTPSFSDRLIFEGRDALRDQKEYFVNKQIKRKGRNSVHPSVELQGLNQ